MKFLYAMVTKGQLKTIFTRVYMGIFFFLGGGSYQEPL
jgi:hypothetical protein